MPDQATAARRLGRAMSRAERHAPYLRHLMHRQPATRDRLASGDLSGACAISLDPNMPTHQALRRAKGALALAVAVGDLAGLLSLEEVTAALSAFADLALDAAIAAAMHDIVPGAPIQGFAALALGKHGSGELNYSSDIDPILIFDPRTMPHRPRDEPVETAVRIAQRVLDIMQARDADGYVFRTDLRLRPAPEATPLAIPVNAAISYYESQAMTWERAAFIRARACAGDRDLGATFLATIQPFVWRRTLDFGVIDALRDMSQRIRDHYESGQTFGPGYDLKRGRGGIREIEFYTQIHQLIHGGRDAALRVPATLDALAALDRAGWLPTDAQTQLVTAYRALRTIEHRLQMVNDQQTHSLPRDAAALDGVAKLHGVRDGGALLAALGPHVAGVAALYDALDLGGAPRLPAQPAALGAALRQLKLDDAGPIAARIMAWRSGKYRALRSSAAVSAFEDVLPPLMAQIAQSPAPMRIVTQLDRIFERLPSALNLFLLLKAQPQLRGLLVEVLHHAPTLANDLAQRADLLDGLIDASALRPLDTVEALAQRLRLPDAELELQLDRVRRIVGEWRFALGVQLIAATRDPLAVAADYAKIAQAALDVVTDATRAAFAAVHGTVPDTALVILALGRFGGGALTHASDLDLIFLFTGDYRATSDGPKPLGAMHYYNRLAQRIIAGLSVPTAAGPLYPIDTRLRPSGTKGELCVSLAGFARYQTEEAWTWEHMALTRARIVYGTPDAGAAVQAVLDAQTAVRRDPATVRADAHEMRAMIAANKPAQGPLDVKLGDGGLVDLEFALQVHQLIHGGAPHPAMDAALKAHAFAPPLIDAYHLLSRLLILLRLVAPDLKAPPPATRALVARACGARDWPQLMRRVRTARGQVQAARARALDEAQAAE